MAELTCRECDQPEFRDGRCAACFLMAERGPDGRYHHHNLDLSEQRLADITIADVTFDGFSQFRRCKLANVTFRNCIFAGLADFNGADSEPGPGSSVVFHECRFGKSLLFLAARLDKLSISDSEFDVAGGMWLPEADVRLHVVTFAGHAQLYGDARSLELDSVVFHGGVRMRLNSTAVTLTDVEFGAASSLGYERQRVFHREPCLRSVAGTDLSRLSVFSTKLRFCTFAGAHNLDGFAVDALTAFQWSPPGSRTRRRVLWDEILFRAHARPTHETWQRLRHQRGAPRADPDELPQSAVEVARTYRALRKAHEDAKDDPGAADLYYGEMEMRRLGRSIELVDAARRRAWAECATAAADSTLLWLYWAVSGYGLRAWRALTALVVVLTSASVIFRYAGFPGDTHTYAASLRFAVQCAMSLLRGTDEPLTPTGEWVALALRLIGPLLFGLALLALRGRVRR